MFSWESGFVNVNGVRLHYTRTGQGTGKPPLVLAHGFSDDGRCWTPLAEALEADFDIIMPDARGHGKSDGPEQGYGLAQLANDLHEVIQSLELQHPVLLGHSMGGATTYLLAAMYPHVPHAIIIEDAGAINLGTNPDSEEQKARWAGMRRWVEGLKRKTRDDLMAEQRTQTPHWSEAELLTWADSKHRLSLNVLNRLDATPVDWNGLLLRIACPALLITADPTMGAMVTDTGVEQLQSLVPQLERAHIPAAGHCIRRDQPDIYLATIRRYLYNWGKEVA